MPLIKLKRVYEAAEEDDGVRVLVDRVWPRGLSREQARVDLWIKELAPSTELRKWFAHDPAKWQEFRRRYHAELAEKDEALEQLQRTCYDNPVVTLLFAAKDREHNNAVALKEYLRGGWQPRQTS
jgi:uncharacterized protein YeaO (DUF488 family)